MTTPNKGYAYGMSAEVQRKIDAKRDPKLEQEIQAWIEAIAEEKFDCNKNFEENLQNGVLLCKVANKIKPKSLRFSKDPKMPFKIVVHGVPKTDQFPVASLYQYSNIPQVCGTIVALGRVCHDFPEWDESAPSFKGWPFLGPREAKQNVREFDEDTIIEGKKVIGIQAGTNKLASQAGSAFGGRRQINVEEGPRT